MDHEWGRPASAGTWLSTRPAWALSALLLAVVSGVGIGQYRCTHWTPLQRFYLASYVHSTTLSQLGFTTPGRYALLTVVDRRGPRFALDADVQPASPPATVDARVPSFSLTREAAEAGVRTLALEAGRYEHRTLNAFLRTWIYQDRALRDLAWPPVLGGLGVLALGLLVAVPQDAARARARRHGRRLKGPELVSPRAFTRGGIGWLQDRRRGLFSRGAPTWVRVPRAVESSHFLVIGDTGKGKSALIRQLLLQVQERGETTIVYDPALEYAPQFFNPRRGDHILNPLDARTAFWTPADELRIDAEALTLAESLFPERPNENSFFSDAPRRIMAFLLTRRPDTARLVAWER